MTKWLRSIRGAIGMGLTWAVAWAIAGVLIGVSSRLLPFLPWDSFFQVFDAPLPALAIPGFVGGALFSIVLGIAARRRRFEELSVPRFAAWGALGGVLLTLFPFTLVAVGLASTEGSRFSAGQVIAAIGGPFILLSAASAAGSLILARRAERRYSPGSGVGETSLAEGESRELLEGGDRSLDGRQAERSGDRVRPL